MASDLRRIDLNLLVALEAVLEECNLTRAAERVGMTQPSMSSALNRLRKVTGDELLIRAGRGYVRSAGGEELLPIVREALSEVRRTLLASRDFDPATSTRRFTISASDYALFVIGTALERRLAEVAPGVEVAYDSIPSIDHGTHLLRRDLVIGSARRGIPGQRMTVFGDRFVCVVSDRDTPLEGDHASLAELSALPYLAGWFGEDILTPADDALAEAGVTVHCVQRAPGLLSLPFLIPGTQLYAFIPERLAAQVSEELGLRVVQTPLDISPLVEAAHWHPLNSDEAGLCWLLEVLAEVGREVRQSTSLRPGGVGDVLV
ncbi:MAG: LysR family transcriptional regulator [Nocardioides sp.]|uniref:LysR family transcriptional regulator n=1 Tax=Nocardioides sp. TaxID=35761 RepID=UPI0039E6155A